MKYTNICSFSLVIFTLFGCYQSSVESRTNNQTETSNIPQEEKDSAQTSAKQSETKNTPQKETYSAQTIVKKSKTSTESQKQNYSVQKVASNQENKNNAKPSKAIQIYNDPFKTEIINGEEFWTGGGSHYDCDRDIRPDKAFFDVTGDGVPNCVDELIDDRTYQKVISSLDELTQGCKERETTQEYFYTVCILNGNPVKATQSLAKGLDDYTYKYWFSADKLIALEDLTSGELFVFNYDGTLSSMFTKNLKTEKTKKVVNINEKDREVAELRVEGTYKNIIKVFNLKEL